MASYSASASSSASSGPSKSGDISGGTAFNIGGINLGTQYQAPATAGGGYTGNPADSFAGGLAGSFNTNWLYYGAAALFAVGLVIWIKKR